MTSDAITNDKKNKTTKYRNPFIPFQLLIG